MPERATICGRDVIMRPDIVSLYQSGVCTGRSGKHGTPQAVQGTRSSFLSRGRPMGYPGPYPPRVAHRCGQRSSVPVCPGKLPT